MTLALLLAVVGTVAGTVCGWFMARLFDGEIGSETVNLWPVNHRLVSPEFRGRRLENESKILASPAEIMRYFTCRLAIGMLDEGIPLSAVAEELGVDAGDLGRWMELYREDGIDALLDPLEKTQDGGDQAGKGDQQAKPNRDPFFMPFQMAAKRDQQADDGRTNGGAPGQ